MIRYAMAAAALRLFSTCPQTKRLYRVMGNVIGSRRRTRRGLPEHYVDGARRFLELIRRYNAIQNGDRLLELGTGWVHWLSIFVRLFYQVEISLFDVWDNRQLKALKRYCVELAELIDEEIHIRPTEYEHVHSLLGAISSASSFDDLYRSLQFHYLIEPTGTLRHFEEESFNAIFSYTVLEHVNGDILPEYIGDFYRLLRPGGYSIHVIDISDHLYYYDRSVSRKNYLRYSDAVWKRCFENQVQYFNRVQRSEWMDLFHRAGLELVNEESLYANIDSVPISREYENLDRRDLECMVVWVVHRKPPAATSG